MTEAKFSVAGVTKFYVPLLMQGFSQSLSYPLVAGIVSHGEYGVNALSAFSQGLSIMFLIGSLGAGLITTGLIFAKTWYGYVSFRRLNTIMMGSLLFLQALSAMPPFAGWIFEGFFALPPELARVAQSTLLWGTVMNAGFFIRNLPMTILFNNLESGKANNATIIRILVTLALAVAFPRTGLTGPKWGLFALTVGVWAETIVTWLYGQKYLRELKGVHPAVERQPYSSGRGMEAGLGWELLIGQVKFALPLALGGFLIACSPLITAAFVARTANAADMLVIHYVTLGVANPVAFAALKFQTVSVKFLPEYEGDRRTLIYAIVSAALIGLIALAFATPWLGDWYFGVFQNVPERILPTAKLAIAIYAAIPIIHAVRARIEGIAAAARNSRAVMFGQIAYTIALFAVCWLMLPLGTPGWVMAITAIFIGPIATTLAVYATI